MFRFNCDRSRTLQVGCALTVPVYCHWASIAGLLSLDTIARLRLPGFYRSAPFTGLLSLGLLTLASLRSALVAGTLSLGSGCRRCDGRCRMSFCLAAAVRECVGVGLMR